MARDKGAIALIVVGMAITAIGGVVMASNLVRSQWPPQPIIVGDMNISEAPDTVTVGERFEVRFYANVDNMSDAGAYNVSVLIAGEVIGEKEVNVTPEGCPGCGDPEKYISCKYVGEYTGEAQLNITGEKVTEDLFPSYVLDGDSKSVTVKSGGPTHTLRINCTEGGTTSPSCGSHTYTEGKEPKVVATPNSGYAFDGWTGDTGGVDASSKTIYPTMDSDRTIKANFVGGGDGDTYTLSTSVEGQGSISVDPEGPYDEGALVTVEANPSSGWEFDHWEDALSGASKNQTITMDSSKSVTAVFSPKDGDGGPYTLSTSVVEGEGSISVSPDKLEYSSGDEVELTAGADSGYVFKEWSGDVSASSNPLTVEMTSDKTVEAHFKRKEEVTLTMKVSPPGAGYINMTQSEEVSVEKGTEVTIQAHSYSGWKFVKWTGDVSGTSKSITITMNSDRTAIAKFEKVGIADWIVSNIQYILMAIGSIVLVGGIVKLSRGGS